MVAAAADEGDLQLVGVLEIVLVDYDTAKMKAKYSHGRWVRITHAMISN